jgi:DNA-binding NarL/FixJ family response regulator
MTPIRVLIVDDHPAIREGLQRMLTSDPGIVVVGGCASGEEAINQVQEAKPDMVLMDIRLPGMSGIETVRQIRVHHPTMNVVMLTAFEDEKYVVEAIQAGANGYLLKDIAPEELRRAVRDSCNGRSPIAPSVARPLLNQFATMAREKSDDNGLSKRQLDILRLIASGASNREIASKLYLSPATVKREMNRIFSLLEVGDRAEAVAKAYQKKLL